MPAPLTLYAEKAGTYLNPATALYGHPTRRWMSDFVMTTREVLAEGDVVKPNPYGQAYVVTWEAGSLIGAFEAAQGRKAAA
jgi:hypothetical protein